MERTFENLHVGLVYETGSIEVTEAAILAFAREYDPQPMHLRHEDAAAGTFGRLVASGWQTASYTMRLLVDAGTFASRGGLGLGIEALKWLRPVEPGDVLTARVTVASARRSQSKPVGIVALDIVTSNQRGEAVLSATLNGLVPLASETA